MELLAENRFIITRELFYEGMLRVVQERFRPFARKCLLVLALLWLVLTVVTVALSSSLLYSVVEGIVFLLVGLWLCVLIPRSRVRRAWKALVSRSGGAMERRTRFYPNRLEIDSGSGEDTVLFYDEFNHLLETKHLIVLTSAGRTGVLIAREGFVQGDLETVRSCLREEMQPEL